ncbi:Acryloyl-CoA reductase electron transfer subunit gamma [Candidatus Izimaplasma bacterium HR1]|jgi:electron transfer flavoprotein beta subunit|uniref:electron transfer flavoprotein subunit beta/FixA family protein n=1 Tax=Candidatus Izimoplasma sp. HR1 TaxID=1541959 RepID=UPI0004F7BE8A|nr:Acryloyl-CoA reductase electron transfer subunit gamma [Candidatus Izimaplasma bacterium HR1]
MNIIVLAKQVPNTTEIKINKETGTLIRDGVESIINPDDLAGIEEALKIKDKLGGSITVITMGPKKAESMLREIYGMGVDRCVLVSDRVFAGSDTLATSTILAEAIKQFEFDLIIAGRQAIDGDTAQVGPQIAELLEVSQVTYIEEINHITENTITVTKQNEEYSYIIECKLPCLITTLTDANKPRYQNVTDLWASFDKDIISLSNIDLNIPLSIIGLKGSPTRVKKTFTKPITKKTPKQELNAQDAAKVIIDALNPHM